MNIFDKVAIVTGGASGLGMACVRLMVQKGGRAAIFDLNEEKAESLVDEYKGKVCFIKTNVADDQNVKHAVQEVMETFGAVHFTINCAGIGFPEKVIGKDGPMPMDKFEKTMAVNLSGTLNVIRHATLKMMENDPNADGEKGVIINTSSIAAYEGQIGQVAYTASKAALVGITLPLAREFADYGIRVVTIAPGIFDTPILAWVPEKAKAALASKIPFPKRFGDPKEFAALAGHILENPIINGETIRLDGSLRMADR